MTARAAVAALLGVSATLLGAQPESQARNATCPTEHGSGSHGIASVVPSSSSSSRLYVITNDGQVYRSENRGSNWRIAGSKVPGFILISVGARGDVLLAGASTGLFVSSDRGQSWRTLACGWIVNDLAAAANNRRELYVGAAQAEDTRRGGGLYRTSDGGRTWARTVRFARMDPHNPSVEAVQIDPRNPRRVFVALEAGGLQISNDGGQRWHFSRISNEGAGLLGPQVTSIAFGPGHPQVIWAGSRLQGVFRGNATGTRWTYRGLHGVWISRVIADKRTPNVAYVVTGKKTVLRTTDSGSHWKAMRPFGITASGLAIQEKDDTLYAWRGRTVLRSGDQGRTWSALSTLPS